MATYDLEEQEKINELKAWWNAYGTLVIIAVVTFVAGIGGTQGWNYYQKQQSAGAAELYASLQKVVASKDPKKIGDAASLVMEKFSGSGYAPRAALISARASFDAGDVQNARSRLQWALDHAKEEELKDLARLRLAGLLLDEKKHDEALKLLETRHGESFAGLYADLRGDILIAAGNAAEARNAYQTALDKIDKKSAYRNLVQMKFNALGEAK